jgi:hypothetical protein
MTSEYDQLLKEARISKVGHENRASNFIPRAYGILIEQGLKPLEAGDKIRDDFRGCWEPSTIKKLLPEAAKRGSLGESGRETIAENQQKQPLIVTNTGNEEQFTDPEHVRIAISSRDQEIESWKNRAKANELALNELMCNIKETPAFKTQEEELKRAKETITQLSVVKEGGFITADKITKEHEIRLNVRENFNKIRALFTNQKSPYVYMKVNGMGEVTEIYGDTERN